MRNILKGAQVISAISKDKPYRLTDGDGLCLLINKFRKDGNQGSKSWQYRYRFDGKSRIFTIGKYPAISLKAARERHLMAGQLVSDVIQCCSRIRCICNSIGILEEHNWHYTKEVSTGRKAPLRKGSSGAICSGDVHSEANVRGFLTECQ